ncbi:hypothetical protein ETAA1_33680 [Urbifossiella limnaea]|uniref:Uncharacterized protein n=2 Tax=Urbifossiella limnaea TaxID=2528023 RepID=A0A517XV60_9BACT|nr:hypothetical protein ETAA1_33680 [Urbifossiella limnaea]
MPNGHPINLIRVFDFYLALMFVISLVRRWEVYWDAIRIIFVVRGRWPRLMSRLAEHGSMLLNWEFFRPAMLAFGLTLIQMICSRVIWPDADLSGGQLREELLWFAVVVAAVVPMLAVDLYFVVSVGRFDHSETVKYLDQAETWLGWRGPLVKIATLGLVNPSQMVDAEVRKSMTEFGATARSSLWWVSAQIGCRVLFGLALWAAWAARLGSFG